MSLRQKLLITVGNVLGVAILIPVIHHYQLRAATEAYIAQLKAQGEPMELGQVIPPPVPQEKNGVRFITNALANLKYESVAGSNTPPAMLGILPGRAMIGWQQPRIIGSQATNSWEDLGRDLAAAKGDLNSFQSLTNHPILDFNLDYETGFDLRLPYLASLKRAAQWLSAAALFDLDEGDPKSACADVRVMLAIAKGESEERTLISQLVRIAITAIGANATWETLQDPDILDYELAQLQQDWQSLEFTGPLEKALMFERVEQLQEFEQSRESSQKFNKLWGYYYAPDAPKPDLSQFGGPIRRSLFLRKCDELRWRWFWSYQDELYGLQSLQVVLDATGMAQANKSLQALQAFCDPKLTRLNETHSVNSMNGLRDVFGAGASMATLRKTMRIETARDVVITAIALKRYELRHHQLPDEMNQLVPDFLKSIPTDYMDGQPLRYRRNADGTFLLYSVGENGKDDGGNPAFPKYVQPANYYWQNSEALDWVWPQPATPEEIQAYYHRRLSRN
jgi:hypothetical protein